MLSDLSAALLRDLPPSLAARLSGYRWQRDRLGRSSAQIFRLVADGRPDLFLKTELSGPFSELPGEALRAAWLEKRDVPCPKILALESHAGRHWLLASAVPGRDLASSAYIPAGERVAIVATGLRRLHGLDVETCPFDQRLSTRLVQAEARMAAGLVDEGDFDEERKGESAGRLLHRLKGERPADADLVVAHGDASFPNMLADAGQFSGFVDLGRLGVADRYQDISLAAWSVRYNLGAEWVPVFLDRYGISGADERRLGYYKALDEFF